MTCLTPVEAGSVLARRRNTLNSNIKHPPELQSVGTCRSGHILPVVTHGKPPHPPATECQRDLCPGTLGCGNQECSAITVGMAASVILKSHSVWDSTEGGANSAEVKLQSQNFFRF